MLRTTTKEYAELMATIVRIAAARFFRATRLTRKIVAAVAPTLTAATANGRSTTPRIAVLPSVSPAFRARLVDTTSMICNAPNVTCSAGKVSDGRDEMPAGAAAAASAEIDRPDSDCATAGLAPTTTQLNTRTTRVKYRCSSDTTNSFR